MFDPASLLTVKRLLPAAAIAATANGEPVDISAVEHNLLLVLDSAAGDGTTPTLAVTLEERASSADSWGAVPADALYDPATGEAATFDVVEDAASLQTLALRRNRLKAQLRAVATIGGTDTPSFAATLYAVGMSKYA